MWNIAAKHALWKREPISDLPMVDLPEVGNEYLIKLDGRNVTTGDNLNVEYLPASAYFNGVETARDLDGIRMFAGVVKSAVPSKRIDGQPLEFDTEAKFEVRNASSIGDIGQQPAKFADSLELWRYFLDGYFCNLTNVGEYILLSWASDSYAGAKCILQRKNEEFFVLRCHEWLHESFDRIRYGRVVVPSMLTERLNIRLGTLSCGGHWSGHSI